jgi:putative alpha-1,2-mannosidase
MLNDANAAWEKAMSCVEVEGSNEVDKTIFYTCLYHALLDPRTSMDVDGRFKTAHGEIKKVDYTHRTMFSGWDVYRSEFPLLTLINPEMVNDEINSLLNIAISANSSLPRWELMGIDSGCMVGDPGLIVFGDAYLKGIKNYDIEKDRSPSIEGLFLLFKFLI